MALGTEGVAPYAPSRTIVGLIEQYRDKDLPTPITKTTLERAGVEASLSSRTLQALKILDLIDDDGEPTDTMKAIRVATTTDLPSVVAGWVQAAYREILAFVNPDADVQRIADQFRHYKPMGMRPRMVTLFLGLCAYAQLIPELPKMPRTSKPATNGKATTAKPKTSPVVEQRAPVNKDKTPPPPGDALQRYIDMLLTKAAQSDELDGALLDRIERALGMNGESP